MIKRNLHWLVYSLFILSCAKQGAPTGGPKDTIPPILVRSIPPNESTNVSPKSIELEFNEMVDASTAKDQLIITPSLGKDFEVRTKRNSVIIDLKKRLDDNTTYHFNFRESVKDVTERNPAKKLQLAISTGDYLDSLSISGNIFDLVEGKPYKDATVALHTQNDTFNILKHPATIVTKTDDKGNFKIDYLKPDYYYLYAFDDKNKNLFVDSRTEAYSFIAYPIKLNADTAKLNLGLIKLDARPLKLTSARPYNTYFNIRMTKNAKSFSIDAGKNTLHASFAEDRSNIKVFAPKHGVDSIQFAFIAEDSIGNKIDTTLYAKFFNRDITAEKFTNELINPSLIANKGNLRFEVKFNKPIQSINFDSIYYQLDSAHIFPIKFTDLTWNSPENIVTVNKTIDKSLLLKPEDDGSTQEPKPTPAAAPKTSTTKQQTNKPKKQPITNKLIIAKGTFISVDQDSSKRMEQQISPQQPADLSEIIYTVQTIYPNIIVQLLDKDLHVISQQRKNRGSFNDLAPGTYIIRAIEDRNNNGLWDPGNYFKRDEPEKIFYYRGGEKKEMQIQLKANFEIELAPLLTTY